MHVHGVISSSGVHVHEPSAVTKERRDARKVGGRSCHWLCFVSLKKLINGKFLNRNQYSSWNIGMTSGAA